MNRYRSSAESYPANQCSLLEGPALFARHHASSTYSFTLPVTGSDLTVRRPYEPPVLPTMPVSVPVSLALPHCATTCLQPEDITDLVPDLEIQVSVLVRSQLAELLFILHYYITLTPSTPAVPNCFCSKGSAPYWSNRPFLIFDIRALWRSVLTARAHECQKLKMVGYTSMAKCKALTGSAVKGLRLFIL